jgi:hypothetical protein
MIACDRPAVTKMASLVRTRTFTGECKFDRSTPFAPAVIAPAQMAFSYLDLVFNLWINSKNFFKE